MHIHRDDLAGAALAQHGDGQQADRPHAEHRAGIARPQPAGPHGMQRNRCGLECSGLIEAHFIRKLVDRIRGHHH
jgi:hypothetical protein